MSLFRNGAILIRAVIFNYHKMDRRSRGRRHAIAALATHTWERKNRQEEGPLEMQQAETPPWANAGLPSPENGRSSNDGSQLTLF